MLSVLFVVTLRGVSDPQNLPKGDIVKSSARGDLVEKTFKTV